MDLSVLGAVTDAVGVAYSAYQRDQELKRQIRMDRFNKSVASATMANQQNYNNPTIRKMMMQNAGYNMAMLGDASMSAPAGANGVSAQPMDYTTMGAQIGAIGSNVASNAHIGQSISSQRTQQALTDAQIKELVSQWCNTPTSFAQFVRSEGGSLPYTDSQGNTFRIVERDGSLMFESDSPVDSYSNGVKLYEWTERDGKFYCSLPYQDVGFQNDMLNIVNGYARIYGFENVRASTLGTRSSTQLTKAQLVRLNKEIAWYDSNAVVDYLAKWQDMDFKTRQIEALRLQNEFKDFYEREEAKLKARLAKRGMTTSDSLYARLLLDKESCDILLKRAVQVGSDVYTELVKLIAQVRDKAHKNSKWVNKFDPLAKDSLGMNFMNHFIEDYLGIPMYK